MSDSVSSWPCPTSTTLGYVVDAFAAEPWPYDAIEADPSGLLRGPGTPGTGTPGTPGTPGTRPVPNCRWRRSWASFVGSPAVGTADEHIQRPPDDHDRRRT
jgi:hypothetical protein